MYRLNPNFTSLRASIYWFQYIICIGWTLCCFDKKEKLEKFQYIICIGWTKSDRCSLLILIISIHHMYRLNYLFIGHFLPPVIYFNTSYVSVELHPLAIVLLSLSNFNTSYVSVELLWLIWQTYPLNLFQYIICIGWTGENSCIFI